VGGAAQPGVGDDQAALGADQLQLVAAGQVEGDVELGEDAGGELQGGGQAEVDPGVAVVDLGGGDAGGFAGEQADGTGAVAAEVAEGAATEGDRAADVVRGDADGEGGPDIGQAADGAVGDQLAGRGGLGWRRYISPSTQWRPAASAASKQRAASAALVARGFSQRTCLPAASALTVHSVWRATGRGT
jgi:hypothetical protein